MNVGIYIYDQVEVLDFCGPFEVFSTASRFMRSPFNVFLVSEGAELISARGAMQVRAACSFAEHPPIDVLVVPGGQHQGEMHKPQVMEWIQRVGSSCSLLASVCTGVFILAQARVIEEEKVTTHWEDVAELKKQYPRLEVVDGVRWVDQGRVVSSAGISAGIDMSLHLVERLQSRELAEKTARQMDYRWLRSGS